MSAPEHRTDPGFAGWGWGDITDRVTAEAAWHAERAGEDVGSPEWQGRIERAAQLLDALVEGVCVAGVYPAELLDRVDGILPAALAAVAAQPAGCG